MHPNLVSNPALLFERAELLPRVLEECLNRLPIGGINK